MPTPQKIQAQVDTIIAHGRRTYTLLLRPSRVPPLFRPGQFCHLALDPYDPAHHWPESRVFSIANGPLRRECIRLTYGVVGAFTARMESELCAGKTVWLKLPYGDFTLDETAAGEIVLVAGGTGFTPFASFLEHMLDTGLKFPLRIIYGAACPVLLVYRELVRDVAARRTDVRYLFFAEYEPSADCRTGRIDAAQMWNLLDRPHEATYYLSGPKAMIDAFREWLLAHGISGGRIRVDAWE